MSEADIATALENVDLVIVQVRYGGYEGRNFDETFSLKYGYCGDEGLGPGGLSAAWRCWPRARSLFRSINDVSGNAPVILLSSPLSLLVRMAGTEFPHLHVLGICELPWTTLLDVSSSVGISPADVDFDYVGVNHIGWFYRLDSGRRDYLTEYANRSANHFGFPSSELIRACSGIPTKYLRLHYCRDEVLEEQQHQSISRAVVLKRIAARSRPDYLSGDESVILTALDRRRTPWYDHAVGPLIEALSGADIEMPFFLSRANCGIEPEWKADDILEIAHTVRQRRLEPRRTRSAVPGAIRDTMGKYVAYERLAAEAVLRRDADGLIRALEIHPWTSQVSVIHDVVREITADHSFDGVTGK
jgi:6-phospho-beta-glucosidase